MTSMTQTKSVAVIGAGLGGLSAAVRLARAGFDVTVYEQNATPGGKAQSLDLGDFHFDTGPSVVTMPDVIADLFMEAGEDMRDHLTFEPLDISCQYLYKDGSVLRAFHDTSAFAREVQTHTRDSAEAVQRFFKHTTGLYQRTREFFLENSPLEFLRTSGLKGLMTLPQCLFIDCFRSMHTANARFFTDPRLTQLFDRYATYNGSNPYQAPATLNVIAYVEHLLGTHFTKGGIYQIVQALTDLAQRQGVRVQLNAPVRRIVVERQKVKGVELDQGFQAYDLVVSNVDVDATVERLLDNADHHNKNVRQQQQFSSSGLVFYWGVKGEHASLGVNNIIFGSDYAQEFTDIFQRRVCPRDPTVYIHISSKYNSAFAPPGCENWFVMINAPATLDCDWTAEAQRVKPLILSKIKQIAGIDLEGKIVQEACFTPATLAERNGDVNGRLYGLSSNSMWSAFLRPNNRYRKVKGLYFCGGSTHPGGGIPLVLLSGKIVRDMIVRDGWSSPAGAG
jgi:phytoene desaturase